MLYKYKLISLIGCLLPVNESPIYLAVPGKVEVRIEADVKYSEIEYLSAHATSFCISNDRNADGSLLEYSPKV
jgi:hypothetical protein